MPRLRLCICAPQHSSYDNPPDLPAFKKPETKKRKESLSDALAGAAVAFASAMTGGTKPQDQSSSKGSASDRINVESGPGVSMSPKSSRIMNEHFSTTKISPETF